MPSLQTSKVFLSSFLILTQTTNFLCNILSNIYAKYLLAPAMSLHDIKHTKFKNNFRLGRLYWMLLTELDPELQHTCSHLEQHEMIGKGCGYFVRKQEQERAAPPALKAWRVLLGSSQLESWLYPLVPFSKGPEVYTACWEVLLSLAIS